MKYFHDSPLEHLVSPPKNVRAGGDIEYVRVLVVFLFGGFRERVEGGQAGPDSGQQAQEHPGKDHADYVLLTLINGGGNLWFVANNNSDKLLVESRFFRFFLKKSWIDHGVSRIRCHYYQRRLRSNNRRMMTLF